MTTEGQVEQIRVAFVASCDATVCSFQRSVGLWADKARAPAAYTAKYPDAQWPPYPREGASPQQRRVEQAGYCYSVGLDAEACQFSYRRVKLVGTVIVPRSPLRNLGPQAYEAMPTVVGALRWTLKTLYGMDGGAGYDIMPLGHLSLSLREVT
ncbi:MAG: hypothetical protein ACOH1Y_11735 [Propionicimonas sp.]